MEIRCMAESLPCTGLDDACKYGDLEFRPMMTLTFNMVHLLHMRIKCNDLDENQNKAQPLYFPELDYASFHIH